MVAIVEAEDRIAMFVEELAGAQNIRRVDTALPAMQEHDHAFGGCLGLRRVKALQADIPYRVEDDLLGVLQDGIVTLGAIFVAGKKGLGEGAADVKGRVESLAHKVGILSA